MGRTIIPDVLGAQDLAVVPRSATVLEAARIMSRREVSSVLVVADDVLLGIFTTRDLARRVVAEDRDLDTPVGDVMTPDPVTIAPDASPETAIRSMFEGGFRHLPVVDCGRLCGIVSRRDLFRDEEAMINA